MTGTGRIVALAFALLLIAGCGGGSSNPAPSHPLATATTPPQTGAPLSTASLTIKYPTGFHIASGKATPQSRRRSPAYINPSPGPDYAGMIDIFVDGADAIHTPPNPAASQDGTQTFTLPLYAVSGQHKIVAIETENGYNSGSETILAIGEADVATGCIGCTETLSLTMQQNVASIGLMSDPADAYDDASIASTFTGAEECINNAYDSLTVYPFAADPTNGFAVNDYNSSYGVGGSAVPSMTSFSLVQIYTDLANLDTVDASNNGSLTGYTIQFNSDPSDDSNHVFWGVYLKLSVPNFGAVVYNDAINNLGAYPGIDALYNQGILPYGTLQSLNNPNPFTATILVNPSTSGCP